MTETALILKDVRKRYGRRVALDGLNLRVPRGSAFGLVGSNGAGKTTTLSAIGGVVRINGGTIDVLGEGPFDPATMAGRVALMPQDASPPPYAEVMDLLVFYARLQGIARQSARAQAREALERVHLQDRADSRIQSLSHGMRRRVVIAQALLGHPELILLDEPMSGLDPREVVHLRTILAALKGAQTLIVSSHNLFEIERICDHVAFIENGRTTRQDSMAAITGAMRSLTYMTEPGPLPTERLRATLPGVTFLAKAGRLFCEYDTAEHSAAALNATILPILLDGGVAVNEVRRGAQLEDVYLNAGQDSRPR